MSQDMSSFFTGMRRILPERVPRNRPIIRSAATPARTVGTATTRNRRLQSGAGATEATAAGVAFNRRKPMTTRLTGGGPGPSGIFQSTGTMRRPQTGPTPSSRIPLSAPRRFREIEWIMKPSKNFIQCSKSSSEDSFPDEALNMEKLQEKSWRRRKSNKGSWSSESSGCSSDESSSSSSGERMDNVPPRQHLVDLLKSSYQGNQMRAKNPRSSRIFCVPNQRILHAEELLQAQMLQMRPRNIKSNIKTQSLCQSSPIKSSTRPLPSRKPSENVLPHVTSTFAPIQQENPYLETPTGLMSCSPSPTTSAQPSQVEIQIQTQPLSMSNHQSLCSIEKSRTSSDSESDSDSDSESVKSQPSQIAIAKPIANNSTNSSSLSTSGTECSIERMEIQRYRGPAGGSKAIKLTSTVIKIMPDKAKASASALASASASASASQRASKGKIRQQSRIKLRSKTTSQAPKDPAINQAMNAAKNPAINQALNAPMIQAIAPPLTMSRVKVSRPMVNQSVHQVVSQLTAQLKKAMGQEDYQPRANRNLAKATVQQQWPRKLERKTSIYLLMDQAKTDEPSPSKKNDWVVQPIEQQIISAANEQKDHRNLSGSEPVNHNYDMYIAPRRDHQGESRENPNPIPKIQQAQQPAMVPSQSKQSELSVKPDSRNPLQNRTRHQPPERSLRSYPRSLKNQPVSVNRIPKRPHHPTVPTLPQQPKQVEQQTEVVTGVAGKIVRKTQHKVPRTMEDGIDMSYQYFVSLPLKRGCKPQVVRYLYRPMVRNLNGLPNSVRRSRRAKRRKAAAAAAAAKAAKAAVASVESQQELEELDPDLMALGGAPLPLENSPIVAEETKEKPTKMFDPEVTLNSPYNVPPLKLKSRYMPMLEELDQMPFPDERLNHRRRNHRHHRQARAAGGSELLPPSDFEVVSLQGTTGGEGDVIQAEADTTTKQRTPVILWSGRPASPPSVPRITVVDYQKEPTRLCTATGAAMMYHQPLFLTLKDVKSKPMIQTYTYESIEQEELEKREQLELKLKLKLEKEQLEQKLEKEHLTLKLEKKQLQLELVKVQLQREQVAKETMEIMEQKEGKPMETHGHETTVMAKSVSFYPEPIFASRESTSAIRSTTSSSSSSSSSIPAESSKRKSKKRKGKKTRAKGKGKNQSKGKGRK